MQIMLHFVSNKFEKESALSLSLSLSLSTCTAKYSMENQASDSHMTAFDIKIDEAFSNSQVKAQIAGGNLVVIFCLWYFMRIMPVPISL